MPKITFYIALSIFLLGCEDSATGSDSQEDSESPIAISFFVQDRFEQESSSFVLGEKIDFVFEVENTSDQSFSYEDTSPSLRIQVSKENESVWYSDYGISFIQVVQEFTIPARHNTRTTYEWDGKNNEGELLAPGTYLVEPHVDIPFDSDVSNIPERFLVELR